MFERYTEKARRVIFFARYEASDYGSPFIESEHLLLGLLREDRALALNVLHIDLGAIRTEIEAGIDRRESFPTSIEVPLSPECKRILTFAAEEAGKLRHRHIGTEHLLLGILREEKCGAAVILKNRGARLQELRGQMGGHSTGESERDYPVTRAALGTAVEHFMEAWRSRDPKKLASLFAAHGQFWDSEGELWLTPGQVEKGLTAHFASAEPLELAPDIRDVKFVTAEVSVVTLVWKPEPEAEKRSALAHRMILVLIDAHPGWLIVSAHLAVLQPSRRSEKGKR